MIDNKILKHKYLFIFLVFAFSVLFCKIDSQAEEGLKEYYFNTYGLDENTTLYTYHINECKFSTDFNLCFVFAGNYEEVDLSGNVHNASRYYPCMSYKDGVHTFYYSYTKTRLNAKYEVINTTSSSSSQNFYNLDHIKNGGYVQFVCSVWKPLETNIPIFSTLDQAENYFLTGDKTGQINKPDLNLDDNEFLKSDLGLHDFIGSNYVNAMWSNELTTILGMHDIFVDVSVGYSNIKSPDIILRIDNIDSDIPLSDYMWTKKLSSIPVPDKDMFIRYIRFTPYYYKSDPGYYEHGKSSYIYLTRNGDLDYVYSEPTEDSNNASHGGGGSNEGNHSIIDKDISDYDTYSEHLTLPDFKLSDVSYSIVGSYLTIKWIDVTEPGEILFVPDNMTQVACFGYEYDINLKPSTFDFIPDKRVTIGDHKISINLDKMFKKYEENDLEWDFKIHLTPIFAREDRDGKLRLYSGGEIIVDVVKGEINDVYYDENGNEIINQIGTESKLGDMIGDIISPSEDSENPGFVLTFDNLMSLFSGFPQLITSLINFVGSIPGLLASVFSFLPSSIASCVSLLCIVSIFVGLLKILR